MPAFSFYSDIVPLDAAAHRNLRYRPIDDFSFARTTQSVAIGTGEFFDAAVDYPIVFIRAPHGVVPVALLGARPDENLFVTENGSWDSSYRPLFIQRYPFITLDNGEPRRAVAFDPTAPNLRETEGERLLDDAGQPSPAFQGQLKFLDRAHLDFQRGEGLAAMLDEKRLLQPMSAQMSVDGGPQVELGGFEVIDIQKLDAMSIGEQGLLAKSGDLALIHAHLVSLRNFRKLLARIAQK